MAQTGNYIRDTGATSLSDPLKENTTLIQLNLSGEHKRNNTQIASINNPPFFLFLSKTTDDDIRNRGATSLSDALKENTTLTQLNIHGEHKRNNTQIALSLLTNQQKTTLETQEPHH